jgi:hypothetical protein
MCVPLPHEQDTNSADTAYEIVCLRILEFCNAVSGVRDCQRAGRGQRNLIGEGAAQEQAVIGETPNLAARLQAR